MIFTGNQAGKEGLQGEKAPHHRLADGGFRPDTAERAVAADSLFAAVVFVYPVRYLDAAGQL